MILMQSYAKEEFHCSIRSELVQLAGHAAMCDVIDEPA